MNAFWHRIEEFASSERVGGLVGAGLVLIVGWILARALARGVERLASRRFTAQNAMIAGRAVRYLAVGLVVAAA